MKFTKLSQSDIRCVMTKQELDAYGIDVDDIMQQSERTRDFFRNLLTQASRELGFAGRNGFRVASAQISFLSDDTISIVFHESSVDDSLMRLMAGNPELAGFLKELFRDDKNPDGSAAGQEGLNPEMRKQFADLMKACISSRDSGNEETLKQLKSLRDLIESEFGKEKDGSGAGRIRNKNRGAQSGEAVQKGGNSEEDRKRQNMCRSFGIRFEDLDAAIAYADRCGGSRGAVSTLHRSRTDGDYYLFIMHNELDDSAFDSMKLLANDFGELVGDKGSKRAYILENSDLIAGHDAIAALASSSGRE